MNLQPRLSPSRQGDARQSEAGQTVVEYILLMVTGIVVALVITRAMVSRSPDREDQGFLIQKWRGILEAIGDDYADAPPAGGGG